MKYLKPYYLLAVAAIVSLAFSACKKSDNSEILPVQVNTASISAGYGDTITVTGNNLSVNGSAPVIKLNDQVFNIIKLTNNSVSAVVPKLCGSGTIKVTLGGKTYDGPGFTYQYKVVVTTLAGSGVASHDDGSGTAASFNCPWGIVTDDNNNLYIADCYNRLIRKITPDGSVSTIQIPVTINGDNFFAPNDIALDKTTNTLYVTDFNQHLLKINSDHSMAVIYNGDAPTSGIAVGPDGFLYMANNTKFVIYQLSSDGSAVSTYSSNIVTPRNIVFDGTGNMYVAGYDGGKQQAAIIQVLKGGINHVVYDDPAFKGWEIAIDKEGNFYEADHFNNVIKIIDKSGNIITIAGNGDAKDTDGIGLNASFNGPQGLAIDNDGNLYVSTYNYDTGGGNRIRKIVVK